MNKSLHKLLLRYGIFLIVMGVLAFALSGFDPKAKTAIMSGGISGLIILAGAFALRSPMAWLATAGRFIALGYTVLLCGVFSWRTWAALAQHGTEDWALYKPVVIGTMLVVSIVSAIFQIRLRKILC